MLRIGLPWSGHRSETLTSILFHGRVTPFRGCTPSPLTSALITTTITNDGGLEVIQRCIFNQNNGNAADRPAYSIGHAAKFRSIPFISCGGETPYIETLAFWAEMCWLHGLLQHQKLRISSQKVRALEGLSLAVLVTKNCKLLLMRAMDHGFVDMTKSRLTRLACRE